MILAALNSDGECKYKEPFLSRDHTERMLKGMGADIEVEYLDDGGCVVSIKPLKSRLEPIKMKVPNDPSSAFFFAVAAAVTKSTAVIKNVTLNKTRVEAYEILKKMGTDVEFVLKENKYEPVGDIIIKGKKLKSIEVFENIPWLIDELPALAIAMALADGKSVVRNAKELRVKESDRIKAVVENLNKCGIEAKEFEDGFEIIGGEPKKAVVNSFGDHRIAMSFAILGLINGMEIEDVECINTSFPGFFELFEKIADFRIEKNVD
jgi:3-phosphoshikimate 1-carboxyvinyltransferase